MQSLGTKLPFPKDQFTKREVLHFRDKKLNFGAKFAYIDQQGKRAFVGWILKETPKDYLLILKRL